MSGRLKLAPYLLPAVALGMGILLTWLTYERAMAVPDAYISDLARGRLMDLVYLAGLFSALLFVAVALFTYFFGAWLKESSARRRLAMFPERNLNPVMSLGGDGIILYANPSALHLQERLGSSPLPPGITELLASLRQEGAERHGSREYLVVDRILFCDVYYLPDFGIYHVYIADITERKRAENELRFQAYHDALTGLSNRRQFAEQLDQALSGNVADDRPALILLGLDRFRNVVDVLGHIAGDDLIRAVADRLAALVGIDGGATLYRFDGAFFAILLPRAANRDLPMQFAETLRATMKQPFHVAGRELFFSFSIGIAQAPQDGQDAVRLFRAADMAVQEVVGRGGDDIRCCLGMTEENALEFLEFEHALRRAEEKQELELHYQPQLDIASGRIVGLEALIRWRRGGKELISPVDFIPLAEETGMILPIGAWVLRTACAQNKAWQDAGHAPVAIAVNLSARQFLDPALVGTVKRTLQETGLSPECLELEVTESAAMHNVELAIATLNALHGLGIKLSIDDFGTGYSSLAYLKRFPIDKLKLDQSFVRNMSEDANDAAIAQAVINLGHSMGLKVIAEGVETHAHLALLRAYGCEEMQGYLFSKPKPAAEITVMLAEKRGLDAVQIT